MSVSLKDQALSDIQFLSHDIPKRVASIALMRVCCSILFDENDPVNELLMAVTRFNKAAKTEMAHPRNSTAQQLPLIDGEAESTAEPDPLRKPQKGRKRTAEPTPTTLAKTDDPRDAQAWRREFLAWALEHDGIIDTTAYREGKFSKEYPNTAFYRTRASQTLGYMVYGQKLLVALGEGKFQITDKGRKLAEEMGLSAPPPPPPAKPEVTLPANARPGGLIERAVKWAQDSNNILDLASFSVHERRNQGSSPGVPKLTEILLRSGTFVKHGTGELKIAAKAMAAGV
jgi:hypothetical protein